MMGGINHLRAWVKAIVGFYLVLGMLLIDFCLRDLGLTDQLDCRYL